MLGTESMIELTVATTTINMAKIIGEKYWRKKGERESSKIEIVFGWSPGITPQSIPNIKPTNIVNNIGINI